MKIFISLNRIYIFVTLSLLCLVSFRLFAITVHKCEDESGRISYQTHCPPGTKIISEKQYGSRTKQPRITPVVYLIPNCPVCKTVLNFFQSRDISITEINIQDNPRFQAELITKTGKIKVPTIIIGTKILSDYEPEKLVELLKESGYSGVTD